MGKIISPFLFVYTAPFNRFFESPFWTNAKTLAEKSPKTCRILVPSRAYKDLAKTLLFSQEDLIVQTLDELLTEHYGPSSAFEHRLKEQVALSALDPQKPSWYSKPGVLRQLILALDALEEIGATPADIQREFRAFPPGWEPIYAKLKSPPNGLRFKAQVWREAQQEDFKALEKTLENTTIFFVGFWDLSFQQQALASAILRLAQSTSFLVDPTQNDRLFRWLITQPGDIKHIELPENNTSPKNTPVICFENGYAEDEGVCQAILAELTNGTDPKHLAVVVADKTLQIHWHKKLKTAGIPVWHRPEIPLSKSALGILLYHAASLCEWPRRTESFVSFLHLPGVRANTTWVRFLSTENPDWPSQKIQQLDTLQATWSHFANTSSNEDLQQTALWFLEGFQTQKPILETLLRFCEKAKAIRSLSELETVLKTFIAPFSVLGASESDPLWQALWDYLVASLPLTPPTQWMAWFKDRLSELGTQGPSVKEAVKVGVRICDPYEAYCLPASRYFIPHFDQSQWPRSLPNNVFLDPFYTRYPTLPSATRCDQWDTLVLDQLLSGPGICYLSLAKHRNSIQLPSLLIEKLAPSHTLSLTPSPSSSPPETTTPGLPEPKFGLTQPENQAAIADRFRDTAFSATQLEAYGTCGYQYFLKSILKIPVEEEETLGLGAAWGSFLHALFQRFFETLNAQSTPMDSLGEAQALLHLQTLARRLLPDYRLDTLAWLAKEETLFEETEDNLLLNWVRIFCENPTLKPLALEQAFTFSLNSLTLRGKIDAIVAIESDTQTFWGVLDYKTGKTLPTPSQITALESLQLPIYLAALQAQHPDRTWIGGCYLQVNRTKGTELRWQLVHPDAKQMLGIGRNRPAELKDDLKQTLGPHIASLVTQLRAGAFSATTQLKHCELCAFKRICPLHRNRRLA
ncbi:MAG: PD-(D/E)XK nuclease family protein [Candidatus Margulisiibacteriota bacterium]